MKTPVLHPNSKYLFELISQEDGRKTQAFVSTPTQIIDWMDKQELIEVDKFYVNFLVDVGAANEVKPDETLSMSDLVMSVPLFSGKAFRLMFRNPEFAGKDLSKYDETVTDDDFKPVPGDEANEQA